MKRVIKPGNHSVSRIECYSCGCVFVFTEDEVLGGDFGYITCPECDTALDPKEAVPYMKAEEGGN